MYSFLLLICLCLLNFQTQPGMQRGSWKTFSSSALWWWLNDSIPVTKLNSISKTDEIWISLIGCINFLCKFPVSDSTPQLCRTLPLGKTEGYSDFSVSFLTTACEFTVSSNKTILLKMAAHEHFFLLGWTSKWDIFFLILNNLIFFYPFVVWNFSITRW